MSQAALNGAIFTNTNIESQNRCLMNRFHWTNEPHQLSSISKVTGRNDRLNNAVCSRSTENCSWKSLETFAIIALYCHLALSCYVRSRFWQSRWAHSIFFFFLFLLLSLSLSLSFLRFVWVPVHCTECNNAQTLNYAKGIVWNADEYGTVHKRLPTKYGAKVYNQQWPKYFLDLFMYLTIHFVMMRYIATGKCQKPMHIQWNIHYSLGNFAMYRTESVVNDLNIKRIKAHFPGTISFVLNHGFASGIRGKYARHKFGVHMLVTAIKVDKDAWNNNMQMQI